MVFPCQNGCQPGVPVNPGQNSYICQPYVPLSQTCPPGMVPACSPGMIPACPPGMVPACSPGMVPACPPGMVPACPPGMIPACQQALVPVGQPCLVPPPCFPIAPPCQTIRTIYQTTINLPTLRTIYSDEIIPTETSYTFTTDFGLNTTYIGNNNQTPSSQDSLTASKFTNKKVDSIVLRLNSHVYLGNQYDAKQVTLRRQATDDQKDTVRSTQSIENDNDFDLVVVYRTKTEYDEGDICHPRKIRKVCFNIVAINVLYSTV